MTERRRLTGLSHAEAEARLAAEGPNALPDEARRTPLRLLVEVVREPMFLLLLASAGLYVVFGDLREALTLAAFVVVIIVITVVQESRTERALAALRDLSSPRAQVLRDGEVVSIAGREVVRGDVVRVAEGDRVPADAILREGAISVDESLLTGESVPVSKTASDAKTIGAPGGDGAGGALFSGTLVASGRGVAEVVATGPRSELGRIGASLRDLGVEKTPLEREVARVVAKVAALGLVAAAVLVVALGASGVPWLRAALAGITLAMALLPEEFPVVLTVFVALGAWRIAKHDVLTRRSKAVETLGAVSVLCTDKTGTLTQNRMIIRRLVTATADVEIPDEASADALPEDVHAVAEYGLLACPRDPFDPMERAFVALAAATLEKTEHVHPEWSEIREYPLSPELLAVTHVWRSPENPRAVVAAKGAPEAIIDLCHLDERRAEEWRARVETMARRGLRVLGVARGTHPRPDRIENPHDFVFEMVGLVGFADPIRPDVPAAIATCRRAGVRVIMITGDHAETARAIARESGIDASDVVLGSDLEALDDAALGERLSRATVVARAVPAHKLKIVQALRSRGEIVGMTGDGVNDAPALKAADIGVAMGARGTDVAREAASLVLVHDDFSAIVHAVRMGRRIYDNLRKAVGYIVAVHVSIAGLSLVPALLGWGALLAPAHVAFLQLVIDPTSSIVFEMEPEEPDAMERPPRSRTARLFDAKRVAFAVAQGASVLGTTLLLLAWSRGSGASVTTLRTLAFVALVSGNLGTLITNRSVHRPFWAVSTRSSRALAAVAVGTPFLVAVVVFVPYLRTLFAFEPTSIARLAWAVAAGLGPVLLLDVLKWRPRQDSNLRPQV